MNVGVEVFFSERGGGRNYVRKGKGRGYEGERGILRLREMINVSAFHPHNYIINLLNVLYYTNFELVK